MNLLIFFILGAILGSFILVVVERMYTGSSWVTGSSRCDSCGTVLRAYDLVPILSWTLSLGRCRHCGARLSARYPLTEASLGLLFALAYLHEGYSAALVPLLALMALCAAIVLYDMRHTVIPPPFSLGFVLFSVLYLALTAPGAEALGAALLVAGVIGLAFFLLWFLSGGRLMGLGDAPFALGLSLMAGAAAFSGLVFSFWIGAVIGIIILVRQPKGHRLGIEVPFAPFLALGFLLAFFTQWSPVTIIGFLMTRFFGV
ncbi:MAG: prepilin peptidase [Patescibacteria group bacterium]|nr:prepilin peptidase [Patescibacteria group bacterium]